MRCPNCGYEKQYTSMDRIRYRAGSGDAWHAEVYESESGFYVVVPWKATPFGPLNEGDARREAHMWERERMEWERRTGTRRTLPFCERCSWRPPPEGSTW